MTKTSAKATAQKVRREEARATRDSAKRSKTKDSYQNFPLNLGIGTDNALTYSSYGFNPITRVRTLLEWMHRGNWLAGVAVDIIGDDMTRAGIEITTPFGGKGDGEERFNAALTKWDVWGQFNEAIKWGRLYGGAILVPLIDGQDVSTPLRLDVPIQKGAFRGLVVLDRWMLEPSLGDLVTEYGTSIGLPKYYLVTADAPALRGKRIHYSRAFRFLGVKVPYWQSLSENLWSLSVYERPYDRIVAFDSATTGAAQKLYKSFLRTLKLKGFRAAAAAGGPALAGIQRQVDTMRRYQSQENISIIDSDDELEIADNTAMTGYSDTGMFIGQQVGGSFQIPMVRLFTQSPIGLGADDEHAMRMYYEGINKEQESKLRVPVAAVASMMAQSEGITLPKNFNFMFRSLMQMSEPEKVDAAGTATTAIMAAAEVTGPAVALRELRQLSRITGMFSSITDEMIQDAEDQPPPYDVEELLKEQKQSLGGKTGNNEPGKPGGKKPAKDHLLQSYDVLGLPVFIETKRGETRTGGKGVHRWSVVMPDDYGYIEGVGSAEGHFEEMDCFVGRDLDSQAVFIIDQRNLRTGLFDEHKVMLGFPDVDAAENSYTAAHSDGRGKDRMVNIWKLTPDELKDWLKNGDHSKPYRAMLHDDA